MNEVNRQLIVVSVGSILQKQLCEKLYSDYKYSDLIFVTDSPFSKRIGSGASVMKIISQFLHRYEKIGIVLSGGCGKRLVPYSFQGKIMSRILCQGSELNLIDVILQNTEKMLHDLPRGVLVYCGDIVFPYYNQNFTENRNILFCSITDEKTAIDHAVVKPDENNGIVHYLQKKPLEFLKVNFDSELYPTDSGTVFFTEKTAEKLASVYSSYDIFEKIINSNTILNLYTDILPLFAESIDSEEYFSQVCNNSIRFDIRKKLFETLSDEKMTCVLSKNSFCHFGTMEEYLENVLLLSGGNKVCINSITDKSSVISNNTVICDSILSNVTVGENCILTDVTLNDCAVPDNTCVCAVKLKDGSFVTVILPVSCNPKLALDGITLWDKSLFCKGTSCQASFEGFYGDTGEKVSLAFCENNFDIEEYINRRSYIANRLKEKTNEKYELAQKEILGQFEKNAKKLNRVKYKYDYAEIHLPARVNLSGTWTDCMPVCTDNGGQVINMAVTVENKLPVFVKAERLDDREIEFAADNKAIHFLISELPKGSMELSEFNLHFSALKALGFTCETKLDYGFRLYTEVEGIDKGSGLGISSILLGGVFTALNELFGLGKTQSDIMQLVFIGEQIMRTGGGWQDQAGGLTKGLKVTTTIRGIEQRLSIEPIVCSDYFEYLFSEKSVIIPTGQNHFGRFIVRDVMERYSNGENLSALQGIRKLNDSVIFAVENNNQALFFECINRHFELLKEISPKISNEEIDKIISFCREYMYAVSPLGAGGGGYLFGILKENYDKADFEKAFSEKYPKIKSPVLQIKIYDRQINSCITGMYK